MAVSRAWDNVWILNKALTRLIKLGAKINAHQHPQQTDLVFEILKCIDDARFNQIKIAQAYGKTAQRLGLTRSVNQAKYSSSVPLGDFLENIEAEVEK